jgi:hypothetical protein
MTVRIQR